MDGQLFGDVKDKILLSLTLTATNMKTAFSSKSGNVKGCRRQISAQSCAAIVAGAVETDPKCFRGGLRMFRGWILPDRVQSEKVSEMDQ